MSLYLNKAEKKLTTQKNFFLTSKKIFLKVGLILEWKALGSIYF